MTSHRSSIRLLVTLMPLLGLAACASSEPQRLAQYTQRPPVPRNIPVQTPVVDFPVSETMPEFGSSEDQKIGNPYVIAGRTYVPMRDDSYDAVGVSSWYGPNFHGRPTSNGEIFDQNALTAAHTTLPLPSLIEVTNLGNGRRIVLRLNDRGPFADDRILDVSRAAARELGFLGAGLADVRVRYLGPADAQDRAAPSRVFTADDIADDPIAARVMAEATPSGAGADRPVETISAEMQLGLQAGSFSQRSNAEAMRRRVSTAGTSWIEDASVNGRRVYRVIMGPWTSRRDANQARRELARLGIRDARIVTLR